MEFTRTARSTLTPENRGIWRMAKSARSAICRALRNPEPSYHGPYLLLAETSATIRYAGSTLKPAETRRPLRFRLRGSLACLSSMI